MKWDFRELRRSFSNIFEMTGRREIGRRSLNEAIFFLGIGTTMAFFQTLGTLPISIEIENKWHKGSEIRNRLAFNKMFGMLSEP